MQKYHTQMVQFSSTIGTRLTQHTVQYLDVGYATESMSSFYNQSKTQITTGCSRMNVLNDDKNSHYHVHTTIFKQLLLITQTDFNVHYFILLSTMADRTYLSSEYRLTYRHGQQDTLNLLTKLLLHSINKNSGFHQMWKKWMRESNACFPPSRTAT